MGNPLVTVLLLQGLDDAAILGCCPWFQVPEPARGEVVVDQRAKGTRPIAALVDREGGGIDGGLLAAAVVDQAPIFDHEGFVERLAGRGAVP